MARFGGARRVGVRQEPVNNVLQRKEKQMVYQEKKHYVWGGRSYGVSAQKIGEHFEMLESKHGSVTRENFLDSATPEDSPFHKLFEWDDEKAAGLYRLQQSNQIINALCVKVETESGDTRKINAFVNRKNRDSQEAEYINIQRCMSTPETKDVALNNARLELKWFKNKYKAYQWYASLEQPIDAFLRAY